MDDVLTAHAPALEGLVPWIVCRSDASGEPIGTDLAPLGLAIANVLDPMRIANAPFLQRLRTLDVQAYGHRAMPNWAFYDCAVAPGALFGLARATPDGLEPVSMLGVIPTADRRADLVATFAAPPALMRVTLALGVAALRVETLLVVTQWGTPELDAFAGFGPIRVETAWTPAHDDPRTVTFTVATGPAAQARMLGETVSPSWPPIDDETMTTWQARVERGEIVELGV